MPRENHHPDCKLIPASDLYKEALKDAEAGSSWETHLLAQIPRVKHLYFEKCVEDCPHHLRKALFGRKRAQELGWIDD